MEFAGIKYTRDCQDFDYTGVKCCEDCHESPEDGLDIVQVDGAPCLLCCALRRFFYPSASGADEIRNSRLSPEEKLLRAIFNEDHDSKDD